MATATRLIPGIRASKTEPVAIVDAIEIRKLKLENLDKSNATIRGVDELCSIEGTTIPSVTYGTKKEIATGTTRHVRKY